MHRFFLAAALAGQMEIRGQDAQHIAQVLRLRPGDCIELVGSDRRVGVARIIHADRDCVTLELVAVRDGVNEPPVSVILAQGLPKGDKMELIIQKAVELGVSEIIPLRSERCVVQYDARKEAGRIERWQSIAHEAAKQSKREQIPAVRRIHSLEETIKACGPDTAILMLYEAETVVSIKSLLTGEPAKSYLLLIGPEGGFSPAEVSYCTQNGVRTVTIGPRILRTETAAIAGLAIVMYQCGDLGGIGCRK